MKNFPDLAIGSIVYGAAGKSAKVLSIDGELLTIDTPAGLRTISLAKVAKVEPPPEPAGIQIGDRLRRNAQPQTKYPKAWFVNEVDDRSGTVPPIKSATVERFSIEGYWVRTPDDRLFHVPESALEEGTWELIDSKSP
jgi:hypothetical protein